MSPIYNVIRNIHIQNSETSLTLLNHSLNSHFRWAFFHRYANIAFYYIVSALSEYAVTTTPNSEVSQHDFTIFQFFKIRFLRSIIHCLVAISFLHFSNFLSNNSFKLSVLVDDIALVNCMSEKQHKIT